MNPKPLPYSRQCIEDDDIAAVTACLQGDWLTQGPTIERFEHALCEATGAPHAVAVASGTAALYLGALVLGVSPGSVGIVPAITFAASANCIRYAGGTVAFADVNPETALIDTAKLDAQLTALNARGTRIQLIVAVDMCGQPAELAEICRIADRHGAKVLEDAAHALGASYTHDGQTFRAASCAHTDAAILSFHPVKQITTGEGGALLTRDASLAARARELRSHGIHRDTARFQRQGEGGWYYEQSELGFHYRITDIQCALGLSQLKKLGRFVCRRAELAELYDRAFIGTPLGEHLRPLKTLPGVLHARHLYVVRVNEKKFGNDLNKITSERKALYTHLRERGILTQVHYIPVNWQPYYRALGSTFDDCPGASAYYAGCLSLPLFPQMEDCDVERVVAALKERCL